MFNYFKTTKFKILFLQILSVPILTYLKLRGRTSIIQCRRKGINWKLDLTEAIDFCLWLTGDYEPELTKSFKENIKPGNIVIDIGANSGVHTLYLASLVGDTGEVHAIEATQWGIEKIKDHLALNPNLSQRIKIHHVLLTDETHSRMDEISASWKINKSTNDPMRNPLDQGFSKSTIGADALTFSNWVEKVKLSRLDFIKLDVDGNEVEVLRGGLKALKKFSPQVYMELSPIHYENHKYQFRDQIDLIQECGYHLSSLVGKSLPNEAYLIEKNIPRGVLVNVLGTK